MTETHRDQTARLVERARVAEALVRSILKSSQQFENTALRLRRELTIAQARISAIDLLQGAAWDEGFEAGQLGQDEHFEAPKNPYQRT